MKKAFTLVEMLVVIGIIALLIAALVPALSGSGDSARAAKCLANMHTLAVGVQARAMETSMYPYAGTIRKYANTRRTAEKAEHGWIGWSEDSAASGYISPYSNDYDARYHSLSNGAIWRAVSRNREVYVCPSHVDAVHKRLGGNNKYGPCWSYVMNAWFHWDSAGKPYSSKMAARNYSMHGDKARTLLFAELPFIDCGDGFQKADFKESADKSNDPVLQYADCEGGGNEVIGFNHRQGKRDIYAHVCFADGHTERFRLPRHPGADNLRRLTKWLCYPRDDQGKMFDIVTEGDEYKQLSN